MSASVHQTHATETTERDGRIGHVLNDFLDCRAHGEAMSEAGLLKRHPELAEDLRRHLRFLGSMEQPADMIGRLVASGVLAASGDAGDLARLGPFRIKSVLGRGGMGVVLEAFDDRLDRPVALKLLRPELTHDGSALQRFTREAKAAAALQHPNIVTVYDVGAERGTHYIAMEYVAGPSLADLIREQGPLSAPEIRHVFREMLSGLAAAHQAGLVHRDIKPSNILLGALSPLRKAATREAATPLLPKDGLGEVSTPLLHKEGLGEVGCPTSSEVGDSNLTPSANDVAPPIRTASVNERSSSGWPTSSEVGEPNLTPSANDVAPPIRTASVNERSSSGWPTSSEVGEPNLTPSANEASSYTVKLADFGLARVVTAQSRMTMPDSILGTPEYMSPEQARGDQTIDHRADLYSAGVVLYEMLTGRTPFRADTPTAVVHQILHTDPPDPRAINASADRHLADLALRLMAKRPEDRFESAADVLRLLDIRGRVVSPERWRRRTRRLALAAVGLVLLAAAVWFVLLPAPITDVRVDTDRKNVLLVYRKNKAEPDVLLPFGERPVSISAAACLDLSWYRGKAIAVGITTPIEDHSLFMFDAEGREMWRWPLSSTRQWVDSTSPTEWQVKSIAVGNTDGQPGDEIVVAATNANDYPARVSVVDPRTKQVTSTFWHMGQLGRVQVEPGFFGGRPAILAWGMNNKLDGFGDPPPRPYRPVPGEDEPKTPYARVAVMMILDPANMDGVSPPRAPFTADLTGAIPYAYAFVDLPAGSAAHNIAGASEPAYPSDHELTTIGKLDASRHTPDRRTAPWFDLRLRRGTGKEGERRAAALLTVDRHLNVQKVVLEDAAMPPSTEQYWRDQWKPIIQDHEYLPD